MKNLYPYQYSTPAGELGLLDGQFPVLYSGRIVYGWTVFAYDDDFVTLTKSDDGGSLYYKMPRSEFDELQREANAASESDLIINNQNNAENSEQNVQFTEDQITKMALYWFNYVNEDHFNDIKNTVDSVFSKLTDQAQIKFALELLSTGTVKGKEIPMPMGKYNWHSRFEKALKILDIYVKNPQLAEYLVENEILGVHCTQSGALPGIVDHHALLSAKEANDRGLALSTGERTFSKKGGQNSISFADYYATESIKEYALPNNTPNSLTKLKKDLESTQEYLNDISEHPDKYPSYLTSDHPFVHNAQARMKDLRETIALIEESPDSIDAQMVLRGIPIALGVVAGNMEIKESLYGLANKSTECFVAAVSSDIKGEFIFKGNELPLENVKIIFTTAQNIEYIKKYLEQKGINHIEVGNIEDIL